MKGRRNLPYPKMRVVFMNGDRDYGRNTNNSIYQVHANGIDIGYKLIGKGEPLVMIMGLGGTMERWPREVTDALSTKYQMIIPDNRGMGYSTVNDTTFTTKLLADDIIALLDALGVRKANVLGYSSDKRPQAGKQCWNNCLARTREEPTGCLTVCTRHGLVTS